MLSLGALGDALPAVDGEVEDVEASSLEPLQEGCVNTRNEVTTIASSGVARERTPRSYERPRVRSMAEGAASGACDALKSCFLDFDRSSYLEPA